MTTFTEVKAKVEFGIELLGFTHYGYKFVTREEWIDTGAQCIFEAENPGSHGDTATACSSCRLIYLPEENFGMNNEKLGAMIHSATNWMSKGKQHPLRL